MQGATEVSLLQPPAEGGSGTPADTSPRSRRKRWARVGGAKPRGTRRRRRELRSAQPHARGRRSPLAAVPPVVLGAAAVVALVLAGVSAVAAGAAVAIALAAAALGYHVGDRGRAALEEEVDGRTSELKRALSELEIAQAETVRRLSMAVEFRDEDTGAHIERIGRFSTLLAEHIGMDAEFCERLGHAAPLHDVGKVAIPDAILLKPGPLTEEERAIVETHAEEGHRLVRGSSSRILDMAATIALSHQEKWDGSGYPRGLQGEAIPIEGRIVAVADVFDALTSDRVYRKAFSVEEAVQMMREQRGRHFDPVLLDAFMEVLGQTGPDAREQMRSDPAELVESTLETFAGALERADAETAEGAIATAIEDGIAPITLHAEVIGPALRRISVLAGAGEIDPDRERRAATITRRVLATLYRYMTVEVEPTRERVLLAGVAGDDHTLGLQMVHDQLAAAGFKTTFDTDVAAEQLLALVEGQSPDLIVVGATSPGGGDSIESALQKLHGSRPDLPIVLSGPAVGGGVPREREGMRVLERIDETVQAVEGVLSSSAAAPVQLRSR
ncbi:MAG TPA: HD domain-containing phosphohydrolase [Solirubrobacteraceae bacterium]|nr:HD domain-containing phosphohydrolase [Solirubrobacteraceae bacterium]